MVESRERSGGRPLSHLLDAILIAAAAAAMLVWTWQRWADPFVDFGRELYVPWQLSEGRVLQRDLAYLNGPLSPYANALLFRLFGVSMRTLTLANIAGVGVLCLLLWKLVRILHDRIAAAAATILFVLLFAFATLHTTGNYNNVAPYSHELTHGMIISVAGMLLMHRAAGRRRLRDHLPPAVCLGLASLTKPEIFSALLAAQGIGVLVAARGGAGGIRPRAAAGWAIGFAAPVAVAWALLATAMPAMDAGRAAAGAWPAVLSGAAGRTEFYRSWSGLLDVGPHLRAMLVWSLAWAAALALLAGASIRVGAHRDRGVVGAAAFLVSGAAVGALGMVGDWREFAHPLPIATAVLLARALLARREEAGDARRSRVLRAAALAFALALLLKMGLFPRIFYYGWALGMPAALLLAAGLVASVPAWAARRGGSRRVAQGGALGILAAVAAIHLADAARPLGSMQTRVGNGADSFTADPRGEVLTGILRSVEAHVPKEATLAVVPEGVMVNYLTRRSNPTPYFSFVPLEAAFYGEDAFIAAFAEEPPDFLLFVHRPTLEYGPDWAYFTGNYAVRFGQWLHDRYERVDLIEAEDGSEEPFGWAILMRLEAAAPRRGASAPAPPSLPR